MPIPDLPSCFSPIQSTFFFSIHNLSSSPDSSILSWEICAQTCLGEGQGLFGINKEECGCGGVVPGAEVGVNICTPSYGLLDGPMDRSCSYSMYLLT
jgi:hypothetical protein